MNINIFQFLKQGTSLNRKSIETNKQLQQKIIQKQKTPNLLYFETGKFNQSDNEQFNKDQNNQWQHLDQQKMKFNYHQSTQKSIQLRKKYHIKVYGTDVPFVINSFGTLANKYNIDKKIMENLAQMGFKKPTPVQMQVIPSLLQDKNVLVTAPTGTGKTLAYLLPIVQNLLKKRQQQKRQQKTNKKQVKKQKKVKKVIIVTPQQQLSTQIIHVVNSLLKQQKRQNQLHFYLTYKCLFELSAQQKQLISNNKPFGINIIITTPQSFLNTFSNLPSPDTMLSQVKYIILDECDKYFEQSFIQQIKHMLQIFTKIKPKPIFGLFSATIQYHVQQLLKSQLFDDVLRIQIGGYNRVINHIQQTIQYCTNQFGKLLSLKNMINQNQFTIPILIFVQQKIRTKQLYYELKKILKNKFISLNISKKIQILSSQKNKQQRFNILQSFQKGIIWILITTDLLARGIDFTHVNLVINYDFPNSMLTYIHRVGRTGRAERQGKAVTFFTDQDKPLVRSLANLLHASGCQVPDWILSMPKIDRKLKKKMQKYPVKRLPVGVAEGKDKNFSQQLEKMEKIWKKKKERQVEKIEKQQVENNGQKSSEEWIQV